MRIAIDARELRGARTGVGRLVHEILLRWTALPAAAAHDVILCAPEPLDITPYAGLRLSLATRPGDGTRWEQCTLPRLVREARADVLFAPAYTAPLVSPVPTLLAIHDVSYAAHPEWYGWRHGARLRVLSRLAARSAARILTISEFSKREIAALLEVDPGKIAVVHLGLTRLANPHPSNTAPLHPDSPNPEPVRILFVGSIFNRRHVPELMGGFARLAASHPDVELDIAGSNLTSPRLDLHACAVASGAGGRIHIRAFVSDADLAGLYLRARAFVFLSDYEGFGLTPLEAMGAGVPIVVLDTAVSREIYGDAALYVTRAEPRLIGAALERVLFDARERARLLAAAPAVLARYQWDLCAARVLELLLAA